MVPLDWGLGHATRCIPLIKEFQANGCRVIIAAELATKSLLQHEFQQLTFIPLRGYRVRYSRTKSGLPFALLYQLPGLLYRIYKEHQWLKKVVKKYEVHAILSDNRFGLYHSIVPAIYITHQLQIKTGRNFTEQLLQKIHYRFIKKYTTCWVPDFPGDKNIAGTLSHPVHVPSNVKYIGCLSRFEKNEAFEIVYDLLILISGPEPQRTIFEELLLTQLREFKGSAILVRGLPGSNIVMENITTGLISNPDITIKNHLSSHELNYAIQQSAMVICRGGYTTIMDLIKLKKRAVLVPTPGQTEQEYLAQHLMQQQIFFSASQENFRLPQVLEQAAGFPYSFPLFNMEQYKNVVDQFVETL